MTSPFDDFDDEEYGPEEVDLDAETEAELAHRIHDEGRFGVAEVA